MKRLLVNLSDEELIKLERLLKKKIYSSRSEAFRHALEILVEAEKSPELRHAIEKLRNRVVTEFRPVEREIKQKIIDYLRRHPGLTINEISTGTGLHRHTVRKYLAELTRLKIVRKKIGVSTVSYIQASGRVEHG